MSALAGEGDREARVMADDLEPVGHLKFDMADAEAQA